MLSKIKDSLKSINYKLLFALIFMGLCPTIYMTVRIYWLGEMPGEYNFSIAGQLNWVNLFYEVLNEGLILPLFYFMGKDINDNKAFTNKLKTGLLISFLSYLLISIVIIFAADPLLRLMATNEEIIEESKTYVRIESVANIFGILAQFSLIALITLGNDKYVYLLTVLKLILSVILDTFLISGLSFSANLGVNGIGFSNIIVNFIMFIITIIFLIKLGFNIFNKEKISFHWTKDLLKVGGFSGLESLVRNLFYMLMIVRIINSVGEQGTYWVANNFIWGWLLLPILQLAELIKQEVATSKVAIKNNTLGYIIITLIICLSWFILIPAYKPFMKYVLNFDDVSKLFTLVMILIGFYVLFAFQNIWDSIFYGVGKTNYMLIESLLSNCFYYGIMFILYITNVFKPSLTGIALMFGGGIAFDAIVSTIVFIIYIRRNKSEILKIHHISNIK